MEINNILESYHNFKEHTLEDRFFKHSQVVQLITKHSKLCEVELAGHSFEGRSIHLLKVGNGAISVFLWSQMHGDEATGTMALFDLLNYLDSTDYAADAAELLRECSLYFMPMVNPDGAARFTRRNAQQIDINRDYLREHSPEAKILKAAHEKIKPHFGFNLHDQSDLWGLKEGPYPAALSFLAPAFDKAKSMSAGRSVAMQVIADIHAQLSEYLPEKIGRFDDDHEPRAFGDNFQQSGTSTILIEGGCIVADQESQQVRKMVFASLLVALRSISTGTYRERPIAAYSAIPENYKSLYHILVKNMRLNGQHYDVGINYTTSIDPDCISTTKVYSIEDLGDLQTMHGHRVIDASSMEVEGEIIFEAPANFSLKADGRTILSFSAGRLQSK